MQRDSLLSRSVHRLEGELIERFQRVDYQCDRKGCFALLPATGMGSGWHVTKEDALRALYRKATEDAPTN